MNGKREFKTLACALFFAVLFAQPLAAASQLIGGTLTVGALKYTPYPAEPGKYADVFIGLDNGAYPIYDVECKVASAFPFSIDDAQEEQKTVAYLPIGQGTVLKYKVRVADNAVTGYNELQFACRSRGTDWVSIKMQVYVQVQEAVLSISEVKTTPAEIKPGDKAVLSVKLENTGNSPIKDVSLKLAFTEDQPFTTIGSSNVKRVALIEPKSTSEASFDLLAYPSAAIKAYRIPLELTYYSANGTKQMRTDHVGLLVEAKPEISVSLDSSTLYKTETIGNIILRIVNKGVADAKFLNVLVHEVPGLKIISGGETYVGALDSDDYQTIEIKTYAETSATEIRLPVAVSFKDANNREYAETSEVVVPLYSQSELEKYGLAAPQGLLASIALAIVVLVIAYFGYTRFLKKKK